MANTISCPGSISAQAPCIDSILDLLAAGPGSAVCRLAADALAALAGPAPESPAIEAAVRAAFAAPAVGDGQPPRASRTALARLAQLMSSTGEPPSFSPRTYPSSYR